LKTPFVAPERCSQPDADLRRRVERERDDLDLHLVFDATPEPSPLIRLEVRQHAATGEKTGEKGLHINQAASPMLGGLLW
jgi:hypothetical protein